MVQCYTRIIPLGLLLTWLTLLGLPAPSLAQPLLAGQSIRVCNDGAEWPPFAYFKKDMNGEKSKESAGYSVDYLNTMVTPKHLNFTMDLIPWARCQKWVTQGKRYHMLMDASINPERAANYRITQPYYQIHGLIFYSQKRFPNHPEIHTPKDLLAFKVCGQHGYNYTPFGIENSHVDMATKTFAQLRRRLQAGRCDILLGFYEILRGLGQLDPKQLEQANLAWKRPHWVKPTGFHMMVSRNLPYSEELYGVLEQAITQMKRTGQQQELLDRYLQSPTLP
ncbi:substrate-binding periplasmic protein [Magnetococcus sp. PR-3]|uniref:substrate-binding periplasmic protein n=1 Tax=Magnetococcus sp. PR-3 TaxID=3120355 RepID=UPI002FCE30C7